MNNTLPPKNQNFYSDQFSSDSSSSHRSKSSNQSYIRTTFYLPRDLHKQLKMVAAQKDRDMSGIIEELLNDWLQAEFQHNKSQHYE